MALRNIRYETDPILRKISKPVKEITSSILTLLNDMEETMKNYEGVGLAAPQIGILKRIVIIDIGEGLIELINPQIVDKQGYQQWNEACLSVLGKSGIVERPLSVKVKAQNRLGEEIEINAEGYLAVVICHELDHLDGILYIDKAISLSDLDDESDEESDGDDE